MLPLIVLPLKTPARGFAAMSHCLSAILLAFCQRISAEVEYLFFQNFEADRSFHPGQPPPEYPRRHPRDILIDLLMGLFRGAVFDHGEVQENCPLALMRRFPSLMGRFHSLMGRYPECLNGPFSLLKIVWKTAH